MNKLLQYLMNQPNVQHRVLPGLQKFQRSVQPCYECGGSVKRYDVGGFYDCPDQEKDPVTGKCKAEVVRGRQANAANKAATKDMNSWAKQVAAMDKELAKEYAAQDAGQITFDYDWMQNRLDKADKKAAIAASKQFFQQNPNVFVADDTSGYSPEQKYIIASKLKQRMSTPMGSKLVQQKYGVDPRFYDLQRIQSDFAPKMGGWDGMRNFLFNVYKENGGTTNQNAFTLPEVVVVGGKDKPTVNAYQKETDKLVYSDNDPYYGVDEYANHYAKTQMAKQYGVPKIRPAEPLNVIKSFMRNRSGVRSNTSTPNPSYIPRTKTTYADFNDKYTKEYLPELSHYVSQNRQGSTDYNKGRLLDAFEYLKGNSPYKVKGTEENFAHEVIQPELTQAFMNKFEEGRAMAMSAAASAMERKKLEQKKQEGGEYDLPQAQWGSFVNPTTIAAMATMAEKAKEFFGFNEPKIVRTPASAPKRLSIRDPRKVMMTTGKPLRPNSDLVSGDYDSEDLGNLLTEAKRRKMSYNDMMNLAAMGFQETKWGKTDPNIGHTQDIFGDDPNPDAYENFINAYNAKMKDADRLKIKDEATRLQVYNGLGKVFPSTEADYHGFKMKKIYGVPVPKEGINLRKNPLYGKQVIDIRDNVLKRNPEFMRYMDSTYKAPMPKEKEFANGGLIKMQKAGQNNLPQRVSINDPRYAELYKNRQVGSYYDGAYSLPDLPEVTVTGKDERIKEGMSKASAKFLQGALGVMGSSQTGLMEVITGKQQTPSQAWGFNTKGKSWYHPKSISNFVMDTVLDPINVLGVGIADDIARTTLKGIGKRRLSTVGPLGNVKSSMDDIKRGSNLRGTGFEEDPFYHKQLFEDRRKSVIERLNTDKGRQRLQNFIDDNYQKYPKAFGTGNQNLLQWFKSGFKDYTKITPDRVIDDLKKMEFVPSSYAGFNKDNAFHWFNKGFSKPSIMNIGEGITPYDALHTFEHELGHFFQRNRPSNVDNILSKLKLKETEDPIKLNVFRSEAPLTETGYSTTKLSPHYTTLESPKNYFTSGSGGQEKMPFAAELRENLLQRGVIKDYYDDITPDILRKHKDIYDKTGGAKRMQRLYQIMEDSPENLDILSQALNKMPQVVLPTAAGALAVKSSLNEKKKQGGPILDPRGQWAHPGKVTRIPSPNITMQGVPYPVYGVGSNGQEQMMYPDQDYNFGGASYVDEYPMMRNGGGLLSKTVSCSNCGHSWKAVDGGHDPLTCHKCGGMVKMQGGGSTKKSKANTYTEVDSEAADLFRSLIPLPDNASQMLAKVLFKDARMSNNSLSDDQKLILWNTIQNARKRSGVTTGGGTEYQDYGNQGYGSSDEFNQWFNRGKMGPLDVARYSLTNPGYKLASTIGRGRYWQDPNNPDDVLYTDVYDWNPSEANFSGSNLYQLLRNTLRSGEDKNLNKEKNDNYRMNFKLSKKEIDEIKKRKEEEAKGIMGLGLFKSLGLFKNGGYTVTRSNDRKGKTHKVTGPDGTVKYFGDSKLGQHPKDPERKAAFYARHKKNLDGNPYFRAFARKTWQTGGPTPEVIMPRSLEELMSPNRRGVANFNVGYNNKSFSGNYGYSGPDNFKNGTHSLNFSVPSFMKTGNLDASAVYSPGRSYSANLTGMAPVNFIKKGATMNFSGGYQKDINPMMKNTAAPSYNMSAGFRIPTKAGNFNINASYRK